MNINKIIIKILQGSVVTQTVLSELTIGYTFQLQICCWLYMPTIILWKLFGSWESYC